MVPLNPADALAKVHARREQHRKLLNPIFVPFFDRFLELLDSAPEGRGFAPYDSLRDAAKQEENYQQGRGKKGAIITNARGWESPHQYGMACDFADFSPGYSGHEPWEKADWGWFGHCATMAGLRWGGDWDSDGTSGERSETDFPHVELSITCSWKEVAKICRAQGSHPAIVHIVAHQNYRQPPK